MSEEKADGRQETQEPGESQSEPTGTTTNEPDALKETWAIVGMLFAGTSIAIVTGVGLQSDMDMYAQLLAQARDATRACPENYLAYTAAIAPFRSFAFFRASVVFLSFSLIVLGDRSAKPG